MRTPQGRPTTRKVVGLRKRIDRLDREMLRLLNRRAGLVVQVGQLKRNGNLPVFDPRRERRILRQLVRANRGPLSRASVERLFREIIRHSRLLEAAATAHLTRRR